jgi:hypothetical protein
MKVRSLAVLLLFAVQSASAQDGRWILANLYGEPVPSFASVGLRQFFNPWLSGEINAGVVGASAGFRATVPDWQLTPIIGGALSYTYYGNAWGFETSGALGIRLYSGERSMEGGMNCTSDFLKGDSGRAPSLVLEDSGVSRHHSHTLQGACRSR